MKKKTKKPPQTKRIPNKDKGRYKFSPAELEALRWMGGLRIPQYQMASYFKDENGRTLGPEGFDSRLRYDDAARDAIEEGRAKASRSFRNRLFQLAMGEEEFKEGKPTGRFVREPSFPAAKFWGETQEGFKRAEKLEVTGLDKMPNVVINLPRNGRESEEE